jgi:hypothetical protein
MKRNARGSRDRFEESVGRKTSITWLNGREHNPGGTKDAFRAHELGRERLVDAYLLAYMPEALAGINMIANTPYMALNEYAPHPSRPPIRSPLRPLHPLYALFAVLIPPLSSNPSGVTDGALRSALALAPSV